jgi:hypothetical protein
MLDIPLASAIRVLTPKALILGIVALWLLSGCTSEPTTEAPLNVHLYQQWQMQPGDSIGGYTIVGGLGDISIALNNEPIYAPFTGRTQRDTRNCVIFSSPELPAYLFRFCGLSNPRFGNLSQGDRIGSGNFLQFATLRKQPNGTWAIVEPSKQILERTLSKR